MADNEFTPVYPRYYEIFAEAQEKISSRVIYFEQGVEIQEEKGKITEIVKNEQNEEYLLFDSGARVRIDRIISINGIPGPAFEEYDRYGMACLDCNF